MRKLAPFVGLGVALVALGVLSVLWISNQRQEAEARRLADDVIEAAQKWKMEGEMSGGNTTVESQHFVEFSAKLERLTRQFPGYKAGKNLSHFAEAVRLAQEERNMALLRSQDAAQSKRYLDASRSHWSEALDELEAAKKANK